MPCNEISSHTFIAFRLLQPTLTDKGWNWFLAPRGSEKDSDKNYGLLLFLFHWCIFFFSFSYLENDVTGSVWVYEHRENVFVFSKTHEWHVHIHSKCTAPDAAQHITLHLLALFECDLISTTCGFWIFKRGYRSTQSQDSEASLGFTRSRLCVFLFLAVCFMLDKSFLQLWEKKTSWSF